MKRLLGIAIAACVAPIVHAAEPLTDAQWLSFFDVKNQPQERTYKCTSKPWEFETKERRKDAATIDGKEWLHTVCSFKGGPGSGAPKDSYMRSDESGFWFKNGEEKPELLAPRPLKPGQTWQNGNETLTFRGLEDFDTFNKVVKGCAVIVAKRGKETVVKYYEPGKGLISLSITGGDDAFRKVAKEYAGD